MIVVIGGVKGGTGKSTIAVNLTALLASEKKKVLLVDADEQGSAADWVEQRESAQIPTLWTTVRLTGSAVRTQVDKLKSNYDVIIIDAGGRDTTSQRAALTIADVFIAPFQPRSLDVWTLGKVSEIVQEAKALNPYLKAHTVLNRADTIGSDNAAALDILAENSEISPLTAVIKQRKAFANATAEGLAVFELKNKDKKAVHEITQFKEIVIDGYSKAKKQAKRGSRKGH